MENVLTLVTKYLHIITPAVSFIVGLILLFPKFLKYKSLLNEILEFQSVLVQAVADGKITKEEIEKIVSESKDIVQSIKDLKQKAS